MPGNPGGTSNNWSGYAVATANYTSIQGNWTVPSVSYVSASSAPQTELSSAWIGIGGVSDSSLIQVGTVQQVSSSGATSYYAFYELIPAGEVILPTAQYPVSPGDAMTAMIECLSGCEPNASQQWVIEIVNLTKNWLYDHAAAPSHTPPPCHPPSGSWRRRA